MKKSALWRLLALLLALVMVLGCLAACSDSNTDSDEDDEDDEKDKLAQLRKDLEKYTYNGLTFYLPEEFEADEDRESFYSNGSIQVQVDVAPTEMLEEDGIEDGDELLEYMKEVYDESLFDSMESGKKNGVHYLIARGEEETAILGLYINGKTVAALGFYGEDFGEAEEDFILYATLGKLKDYYKDHEYEEERPQPAPPTEEVNPTMDFTPDAEYSKYGLHYMVPSWLEMTAKDPSYTEFYTEQGWSTFSIRVEYYQRADYTSIDDVIGEYYSEYEAGLLLEYYNGVPCIRYVGDAQLGKVMGMYFYEGNVWLIIVTYEGDDVPTEKLMEIAASGWVEPSEVPALAIPELTEERAWELFDMPNFWLYYFRKYGSVNYDDTYELTVFDDGTTVTCYALNDIYTLEDFRNAISEHYSDAYVQAVTQDWEDANDLGADYEGDYILQINGTIYAVPNYAMGDPCGIRETMEIQKIAEGEYIVSAELDIGERSEMRVLYEDGQYKIATWEE